MGQRGRRRGLAHVAQVEPKPPLAGGRELRELGRTDGTSAADASRGLALVLAVDVRVFGPGGLLAAGFATRVGAEINATFGADGAGKRGRGWHLATANRQQQQQRGEGTLHLSNRQWKCWAAPGRRCPRPTPHQTVRGAVGPRPRTSTSGCPPRWQGSPPR